MEEKLNRHQIRYIFEHKLLPRFFYREKKVFISIALQDKEFLYRTINKIFMKEGVDNPYSPDDFTVSGAKIVDGLMVLKITFPEPEEEPLCYCSYAFFDDECEKIGYYCIEKGNAEGSSLPFVCYWGQDENHYNYGKVSLEKGKDLERCLEIHMQSEYGRR